MPVRGFLKGRKGLRLIGPSFVGQVVAGSNVGTSVEMEALGSDGDVVDAVSIEEDCAVDDDIDGMALVAATT